MKKILSIALVLALGLLPACASAANLVYAALASKGGYVQKIKLNATSAKIINHYAINDTYRLVATILPYDAEDKRVSWSSSNEAIVTVSPDGLVTAVGEGNAVITASADDRNGLISAKCNFNVKTTRVTSFSLGKSEIYLDHTTSDETTIEYSVFPSDATFQDVSWTSSDKKVASVDMSTGVIKAVGEGRARITAVVDMGRKKSYCDVVVRDKSKGKTITVCAIGDLVLGGDPDHNNGLKRFDDFLTDGGKKDPDYGYNLKNAKWLFDSCDLTVANLEVALTNRNNPARAISSYNFRGKPEYAEILKKGGVDVVSIANNHTPDFGGAGVADTRGALTKAGISFCALNKPAFVDVSGVRVAVAGIMTQSGNSTFAIKRQIRAAAGADLIIMLIHGAELTMYDNVIRQSQITNAKTAIDAGAHMVVFTHPAVISGIGKYKGRYIFFDMGTFVGSGTRTCVINYAATQSFTIGKDSQGSFVESSIPTVYPGFSSGFQTVISDKDNNCQPVLFGNLGTPYANAMSDRTVSTIKSLSRKLTGAVTAGEFNVG